MAKLPRAVHLIAQAPHLNLVRILHPVGDTHIAVLRSARVVAVFQEVTCISNPPRSQIDRHHHL